ncbi:Tetratricopeptide repeat protein 1 [Senna tora]|uniref:Tetratricopeptide repeat protein 1 n=1 Tax=Senna tora TaxID=362788 RepID=A0A834XCB6_9FABA|nr:Tetratricopeptide repeat protein 1 [Senna tora]
MDSHSQLGEESLPDTKEVLSALIRTPSLARRSSSISYPPTISSIHLCYFSTRLLLRQYENTIKECTKALELNPIYVKALVRRGEAHEKLEHFDDAIAVVRSQVKEISELGVPKKFI